MHPVKLKVLTADIEDVYRDIARIPLVHRGGVTEGAICRIKCNKKSAYVAVRGLGDRDDAIIKLDEKTRNDLEVKTGQSYDFELKALNFLMEYWAAWYASDPFARIAFRMSLISLVLGITGLLISIIPLVPLFCK